MIKQYILSTALFCCWTSAGAQQQDFGGEYIAMTANTDMVLQSKRPAKNDRLFTSEVIEKKIKEVKKLLKDNAYLAWMFENCFPNTLETTVHYRKTADGDDDTFVYTGDIHAMWLRDSGAQVWPYVRFAKDDPKLAHMLRGVILRQFRCLNIDPYANAFNKEPNPNGDWMKDLTKMIPELHERKWEIDSLCYVLRLAYEYWKQTGDTAITLLGLVDDHAELLGSRGLYAACDMVLLVVPEGIHIPVLT